MSMATLRILSMPPICQNILNASTRHAVDASLGRRDHVGLITLGAGPLRPGLGVKKKLPEVGNVHITGIVNESSNESHSTLQTTRLCVIMQIADVITSAFGMLQSD